MISYEQLGIYAGVFFAGGVTATVVIYAHCCAVISLRDKEKND